MLDDAASLNVFEATHDADVVVIFILQNALVRILESFVACGLA